MMGRKQRDEEARKQLEAMNQQLQSALKLLAPEEADAIIGELPADYLVLLKAIEASTALLFAAAQGNGMRKNEKTMHLFAQSQMVLSQLIHHAYALGMKRGQQAE